MTAAQLRAVIDRLVVAGHWQPGDPPILIVTDAGYDITRLAYDLADLPVELVGRIRSDRVLRLPKPPRAPGTDGRPPKHGPDRRRPRNAGRHPGDAELGPARSPSRRARGVRHALCRCPPAPAVGAPMTVVDQSLVPLTLHVGRTSARDLDLTALLSRICTALPDATGAAGAAVLVMEPSDREPTLVASDAEAGRIGEVQRHGGAGPLQSVTRSGRPLRTPDLTRVGPPALAAAAAETGLTSSLVLPLIAGDERYGALQLLGTAARPVDPSRADGVRALLAALVARLVDVRALRQAADPRMPVPAPKSVPAPVPVSTPRPMPVPVPVQRAAPPQPRTQVDPGDVATMAIPAAIPAAVPAAVADAEATHVVSVPAQRRPAGARHRRSDEPEPARLPDPALVNGRHAAPADAPESRSGPRRRRR